MTHRLVSKESVKALAGPSNQFIVLDESGEYAHVVKATVGKSRKMTNQFLDNGNFQYAKPLPFYQNKLRKNCVDNVPFILITLEGPDNYVEGWFSVKEETQSSFIFTLQEDLPLPSTEPVRNYKYRSKLEKNLHIFFELMEVQANYETVNIQYTDEDGRTKNYTVDFYVPSLQAFIELKPTYPTEQEIQLCETLSRHGYPILLLYGNITCPRYKSGPDDAYGFRPHAHGLRGIRWDNEGIMKEGDLLPMYDGEKLLFERCVSTKDKRWCHPKLIEAYSSLY